MFILGEYTVCALVVFMLGAMLLLACGIGYLLRAAGLMSARALQALAHQTRTLRANRLYRRDILCSEAERNGIANCPS